MSTSHNGSRRMALVLEYDGTMYKGFQWQTNAPSIQREVERAIKDLTREPARVRAASRTDSGAHARGQVVDFLTKAPYMADTFVKALNWYLPPDIRVRGARDASPDFHSRKDAVSRVYRYTLLNTKWPSALMRGFSHWVPAPLDVTRMGEAASCLPGIHDFSALTVSPSPRTCTVRRVDRWDVWKEGELVLFEAQANGFLLHQIRRTNALLVEIGLGRLPTEVLRGVIDGTIKLKTCPSVPAKGLCLMKVNYQNDPFGHFGYEGGNETE